MKPSSSKGRNPEKSVFKSSPPIKTESSEAKSSIIPSIVPYAGHPHIPLLNQYSALGSTLSPTKPNYQSVLVNQYDPYKTGYPPVNYKKSPPYITRTEQFLFYIEPSQSHLTQLKKSHIPA